MTEKLLPPPAWRGRPAGRGWRGPLPKTDRYIEKIGAYLGNTIHPNAESHRTGSPPPPPTAVGPPSMQEGGKSLPPVPTVYPVNSPFIEAFQNHRPNKYNRPRFFPEAVCVTAYGNMGKYPRSGRLSGGSRRGWCQAGQSPIARTGAGHGCWRLPPH